MTDKTIRFIKDLLICLMLFGISLLLVLITGCCQPKVLQDSLYDSISVKTVCRTEIVNDTVYVEIPYISEKNVTKDTVSVIENDYARTEALIEDGFLYHSLETKPQQKPVKVEKVIEYRDSIIEKLVEKEKVVQHMVEKPDTLFEKIQKRTFWILCVGILVFVVLKRSNIANILKSIIDIFK